MQYFQLYPGLYRRLSKSLLFFEKSMEILNTESIFDKGLKNEHELTENEKLIYSLAYFESIADMEGWDHFFTYSMKLYPSLIKILKLAGDHNSLRVLMNYENHF